MPSRKLIIEPNKSHLPAIHTIVSRKLKDFLVFKLILGVKLT